MRLAEIKRGNSFKLSDCQLLDDTEQPIPLSNIDIRSQLRDSSSRLVAELVIVKHSEEMYYDVIFPETEYFPLGDLTFDIEYVDNTSNTKFDTATIILPIIKDETRPI